MSTITENPLKSAQATTQPSLHTAFAGFTPEMLYRLHSYGTEDSLEAGSFLFTRGARHVDMFVVLDGSIEVFERHGRGLCITIATLGPSQFTGELDLLDNRPTLVDCRAVTNSRVLKINRLSLQQIMRSDLEIADLIMRACIGRRFDLVQHASGGITLIGQEHSADTIRLRRFLTRNGYPFRLLNADTDSDANFLIRSFELAQNELPVALLPDQRILRNPSNTQIADELGFTNLRNDATVYDVAVVGAGPAGLAAAVYAASEGLSTIVIEGTAPGGQAGTSSRIENYLGFPTGISGQELSEKSLVQAQKFGARFAISRDVISMKIRDRNYALEVEDAVSIVARTVIIATGARYQKLNVPNYERFEYQGIHYAATAMEAGLCHNEEVLVVGAGNSAGQAALFLSQTAKSVHLLVRGEGLEATMSDYLVQRIHCSRNIHLRLRTEIVRMDGDDRLRGVTFRDNTSKALETKEIANVFVLIGASPKTKWLCGELAMDAKGFILTGAQAGSEAFFGTSLKGIYAVGDVRSGSVKRVASAVGEGSVVISEIHKYLAQCHASKETSLFSETPSVHLDPPAYVAIA